MSQEPTSEMTPGGGQERAFERAPALLAVLSPSGELLALWSWPSYDPNLVSDSWFGGRHGPMAQ